MTAPAQQRLRNRTCPRCAGRFLASSTRKTYCDTCGPRVKAENAERLRKPPVTVELTCEACGDRFTHTVPGRRAAHAGLRRACSSECAGRAGHPGSADLTCPICDATFTISAQYAEGATCSRACARWQRLHPGRKRAKACGRCGGPIDRPNINAVYCSSVCAAVAGQARRDGRAPLPRYAFCLSCGGNLGEGRPTGTLYCRRACQAIAGKERRAAKIAGARVERVYPIDVYERDGWCCHLCGAPIDPAVTGRYDPQRVSLDHIIAVNAPDFPGHVWENVAAAHLGCNIAKGDAVSAHDRALYERLAALRAARAGIEAGR